MLRGSPFGEGWWTDLTGMIFWTPIWILLKKQSACCPTWQFVITVLWQPPPLFKHALSLLMTHGEFMLSQFNSVLHSNDQSEGISYKCLTHHITSSWWHLTYSLTHTHIYVTLSYHQGSITWPVCRLSVSGSMWNGHGPSSFLAS